MRTLLFARRENKWSQALTALVVWRGL